MLTSASSHKKFNLTAEKRRDDGIKISTGWHKNVRMMA